eukprot:3219459-Pleurochrysis_carterae.AAC.1
MGALPFTSSSRPVAKNFGSSASWLYTSVNMTGRCSAAAGTRASSMGTSVMGTSVRTSVRGTSVIGTSTMATSA